MKTPARLTPESRSDAAQATLARFAVDQRGNVAMIFALCSFVLLGITGVALDFTRTITVRQSVQNALDSATLAAAELQSRGGASTMDLQRIVATMLSANVTSAVPHVCARPALTRDIATGRVSIDLSCDTPTTLSALLGFPKLTFTVASTAEYARTEMDVAMMLDITGSMSGQKLRDLKSAAKLLVDTVVDPDGDNDDVRIALAPFSASVNAGSYFRRATNVAPGASTCVTERLGGQAYSAVAPRPGAYSVVGPANCPAAAIQSLAYDPTTLKRRIDAFSASGNTAGHLGVAWARYLISPEWSSVWPSASAPLPYGDPKKVKAVILMTDGEFNTQYSALGTSAQQARRHCDAMKAEGVIVYAVAFQAGGAAEALLRQCATSADTYFRTTTGDALRDAYHAIGLQLRRLRISH